MDRYEIREEPSTDVQRGMGFSDTVFKVWDVVREERVPFGTYADRAMAERRIARMEERQS